MGYQQPLAGGSDPPQLNLMMTGQITTLEPDFPNGGSPTLQVRGLNILHVFARSSIPGPGKVIAIVRLPVNSGKKPVSDDKPGLGIEVTINKDAASNED